VGFKVAATLKKKKKKAKPLPWEGKGGISGGSSKNNQRERRGQKN